MKKNKKKVITKVLKKLSDYEKIFSISVFKPKKHNDKRRGKYLIIGTFKDLYYSFSDPRSEISDKQSEINEFIKKNISNKYFIELSIAGEIYLRKRQL